MRKRDFILIGIILAISLLAWGIIELAKDDGAYVVVEKEGHEIARYSLSKDGEYELNGGTNILKIENGEAWMIEADCREQDANRCTNQGKISKTLENIICAYNRIEVRVEGADNSVSDGDDVEIEVN